MKTTKHILAALTLTTALTLNLSADTETKEPERILHKITVETLEVEIQNTPRLSYNGPQLPNQPDNKKWLEIEAKLKIETLSKLNFLPSLDATFHVVTKGEKGFVRTEKTITFKNINIENGEAWVSAYIDPDTLRVITQEKRPKVNHITGIAVTIDAANLFKGKDQQYLPFAEEIYDRSIVKARKDTKNTRWWTNLIKSDHQLLALEETPFSSILSDRYPRINNEMKSAMR